METVSQKEKIKEKEDLIKEIERYFECSLSDEEERALRDRLMRTGICHPAVDEAKALMGFRTICYRESREEKKTRGLSHRKVVRLMQGVAASLLLMAVGAGIVSIFDNRQYGNECRAYINGRFVSDDDDVLALLTENIQEFNAGLSMAQDDLMRDMGDFETMVERIESEFNPEDI
ncbi:MAG: hypothetical protein K2H46_08870 [Muribaculaceae bacterium]|nr:hypothetical protein [Muribaculaceae bacterium]